MNVRRLLQNLLAPHPRYMATWGQSYINPGELEVGLEIFTDENGYDDRQRGQVYVLQVGDVAQLDGEHHTVRRIA